MQIPGTDISLGAVVDVLENVFRHSSLDYGDYGHRCSILLELRYYGLLLIAFTLGLELLGSPSREIQFYYVLLQAQSQSSAVDQWWLLGF